LGNGTLVIFWVSNTPDLQKLGFSDDIPHLGQLWDDVLAGWDPSDCPLYISGHAIAIKYWREVYIKGKKQLGMI
ncbi:hypothetical protein P691DRAFT_688474, partial [Macrolepiota fuliginosa MF-IS2]